MATVFDDLLLKGVRKGDGKKGDGRGRGAAAVEG